MLRNLLPQPRLRPPPPNQSPHRPPRPRQNPPNHSHRQPPPRVRMCGPISPAAFTIHLNAPPVLLVSKRSMPHPLLENNRNNYASPSPKVPSICDKQL